MTLTVEPRRTRRRLPEPACPEVAEIDALMVRNPGWYAELSEEKRRLLEDGARKILGA